MEKNNLIRDFTDGKLFSQMIRFTIPFVIANLLQTLYTVVDLAIVGHCADGAAMAAVSIAGEVSMLITLIGSGIANGGQIYIAQLLGQKRRSEMNHAIGTFFTFGIIAAVFVAVVCFAGSRLLLSWLNTPEEAMDSALAYLRMCCPGFLFVFGYNCVCAVLRGMGESKAPTVFVAITAGVNVVGDLILVMGLRWGAFGAALATVLSQAAAFVASLVFLYRRREEAGFDFHRTSFRPEREKLYIILRLAFPLVAMQMAINISMLFVSAYINVFGTAAASISGIGNKLYSVISVVSGAFSAAMATVVGQNLGAGKIHRIRNAMRISVVVNMVFFVLIAVIVLLFPTGVFRIFTNDADVLALAPSYLQIAIWAYLCFALMHPALGLINGVGNTNLSFIIGVLDGVVARIGLSMLLGDHMGMWGYFWGYCLAGSVSVIVGWLYYFSHRWEKRKPL